MESETSPPLSPSPPPLFIPLLSYLLPCDCPLVAGSGATLRRYALMLCIGAYGQALCCTVWLRCSAVLRLDTAVLRSDAPT